MTISFLYNNHPIVKRGADVRVKTGFITQDGNEYITLFTGNIDQLNLGTNRPNSTMGVKCRDEGKRLKLSNEHALTFLSQDRFFCDFSGNEDLTKFSTQIQSNVTWSKNLHTIQLETYGDVFSVCLAGWGTSGWYEQQDIWLETKIRNDLNVLYDNQAGLIWRCTIDATQGYIFTYNWKEHYFRLYRRLNPTWKTPIGTLLASSSHIELAKSTWYWMRVIQLANTSYCYYSTDGLTWVLAITYTDTTPLTTVYTKEDGTLVNSGYNGLCGKQQHAGLKWQKVLFRNFIQDVSIGEVAERLAAKVGITDVVSEMFADENFNTSFDWPHTGGTGYWIVASDRLVGKGTSTWGYIRSDYLVSNFILDFELELPTNKRAGIMYCTDTLENSYHSNFYIIEIDQSGYVRLQRSRRGVLTEIGRVTLSWLTIPANVTLPYRLSFQDGFTSLWCAGVLIGTFYDSYRLNGYLGLASYQSTEAYFHSFRIPKLNRVMTRWSVNVGDTLGDSLTKLISDENGLYYFDGDGRLLLGKLQPSVNTVNVFTPTLPPINFTNRIMGGSITNSDLDWISVAQIDGETGSAKYQDPIYLQVYGYRFAYKKLTQLKTDAECLAAAQDLTTYSIQQQVQRSYELETDLRLERRDRIHIYYPTDNTDDDFIVDGVTFSYRRPTLSMNVDLLETYDA
jgi:hypothetical protein